MTLRLLPCEECVGDISLREGRVAPKRFSTARAWTLAMIAPEVAVMEPSARLLQRPTRPRKENAERGSSKSSRQRTRHFGNLSKTKIANRDPRPEGRFKRIVFQPGLTMHQVRSDREAIELGNLK